MQDLQPNLTASSPDSHTCSHNYNNLILRFTPPTCRHPQKFKMCKYYAHTHPCGHTKTVFAAFCSTAALVQKPCGQGDIWATVKLEVNCAHCGVDAEPAVSSRPKKSSGTRKVTGR
ncbi:hypothetical protein EJ03DRAFT_328662 [Teratosphaeria nubilosa]|uniref:Uncharacterized protein n=1 Tax=Teratosphaeria nubilosa TaxID=161662 RepID=A0A6G1L4T0_9PEZI|nr:hypothetical protein EJ03DRAFT_328662 [Teratosphaeria nubilosa]